MTEYNLYSYDDCPPEAFQFRYKVYVEELHRKQTYADHEKKVIIDTLDPTGKHVVATKDGEIIGVVRLNMVRDGGVDPYFDFYELGRLPKAEQETASICTRNMVAAEYRSTGVSVRMLKMVYEHGIRNGATSCYMDVNEPLIGLFKRYGYKELFEKEHADYGLVTVMVLPATDLKWLTECRSPFASNLRKYLDE